MDLPELNNRFQNTINDLQTQPMGEMMVRIASNALTLMRDRITQTGTNAEGSQYPPYSTKPMLASRSDMGVSAYQSIAGSKKKRKELSWVTIKTNGKSAKLFILPQGYKQYRELHGRQTAFVDFSFSGEMWKDIVIKSDTSEHNSGMARIGARTPENNKKLEGNTKRKGDIMKLSAFEIDDLVRYFDVDIEQILIKNGL